MTYFLLFWPMFGKLLMARLKGSGPLGAGIASKMGGGGFAAGMKQSVGFPGSQPSLDVPPDDMGGLAEIGGDSDRMPSDGIRSALKARLSGEGEGDSAMDILSGGDDEERSKRMRLLADRFGV